VAEEASRVTLSASVDGEKASGEALNVPSMAKKAAGASLSSLPPGEKSAIAGT